jgi:hypothetical protein
VFSDVESGAIDIDKRSQTDSHKVLDDAGCPRDGGIADLLHEAASPEPRFSVALVEDIERAARDTFNSIKLERDLGEYGIPLLATDEPADLEGANPTTILVRRVKQGVAEWYRINLKVKTRKGLEVHTQQGYNNGPVPWGYDPDRIPHPVAMKAAQGRTKTRLVPSPDLGQWVTQMYTWRVVEHVSREEIAGRLESLGIPAGPDGQPWSPQQVGKILANPKYTGYMVYGRTRNAGKSQRPGERKIVNQPRDKWVWSPEPTHPALVTMEVWEAAQEVGKAHERIRDTAKPSKRGKRAYPFRARIMCNQCKRRMTGATRDGRRPGTSYTYYICPHRAKNPRDAARTDNHVRAAVREETITSAVAGFISTYVFGSGRAEHLAALLPASATDDAQRRRQQVIALGKELAKLDNREKGAARTIADLGDSDDPADKALRDRQREIYKQVYADRAAIQARIDDLSSAPASENDPALLDEIPRAAGMLLEAPDAIREQLYAALDLQVLYRADKNQATVWVTLTENTPGLLAALLDDARTDADTGWTTSLFAYAHLRNDGIAAELANISGV